jgi:hypothetical protein
MSAVTTRELGQEICDALGLPMDQVSSIDLRFHACEVVTATVQFIPHRDQLGKLISVLKRYQLHEISSETLPVDG